MCKNDKRDKKLGSNRVDKDPPFILLITKRDIIRTLLSYSTQWKKAT